MLRRILQSVIGAAYEYIGPWYVFTFLGSSAGIFARRLYTAVRGPFVRFRSRYGFFMEVSSYEHWMSGYLFLGETNPLETAFVRNHLRKGDAMIDVGAHNGWYSMVASQSVGPQGHVIAFEPNPQCIKVFRKNLVLNESHNIRFVNAALSDRTGSALFWIGDDMGGSLMKDQTQHVSNVAVRRKKVRTYRLDDYLAQKNIIQPIRLIKIDVEGAELEVLTGARKTLKKHTPAIISEVYCKDQEQQKKRDTLFSMLKQLGYVPYHLTPDGTKRTQYQRIARDTINIVLQHRA